VDADHHMEAVVVEADMVVTAVAAATYHEVVVADTVVEVGDGDRHTAHTRRGGVLR
jgi:cephalosporin hydroxylase